MSLAEKIAGGIILVGLATTLTLSDRQTANILKSGFDGFTGALRAAMGR